MTVLGSPHTQKSLSPPYLVTQGMSWRKRRKVRCQAQRVCVGAGVGTGWSWGSLKPGKGVGEKHPAHVSGGHRSSSSSLPEVASCWLHCAATGPLPAEPRIF